MKSDWDKTSQAFKARIIGKLLGDGCITKQQGRKPRFQYIHTATDYPWSIFCYNQLRDYIPLNPPRPKKYKDPRLKQGYSYSHYTQSKTSNIITYLRSEWYRNSQKIIPFESIFQHFNEESLSWWYMDDGNLKQDKDKPQKVILSTDSFTKRENLQLICFLNDKFNLTFRLDKQNRIILYDQYQIHNFLHLVTPFIHQSMHRKTIKSYTFKFPSMPRRTTIYLPAAIDLPSPTKDINEELNNGLEIIKKDFKNGIFYRNYQSDILEMKTQFESKPYQIIINENNLEILFFLKSVTGLTFSQLSGLCFKISK